MNRKGFTLIELLAVIVVLGLVLLISVPIISDAYTKSKIKSEEVFVDRLTQAIDSYVKLNSDTMSFSCKSDRCEGRKTENGKEYDITLEKEEVEDDTKDAGTIIYQSRPAGSTIAERVTLKIKVTKKSKEAEAGDDHTNTDDGMVPYEEEDN